MTRFLRFLAAPGLTLALLLALPLTACTTAAPPTRHPQFTGDWLVPHVDARADQHGWRAWVDDPQTAELVERALSTDDRVRMASTVVALAKENEQMVAAGGVPTLSISSGVSSSRTWKAGLANAGVPSTTRSSYSSLAASFEPDLFGRIAAQRKLASRDTEQAELEMQTIRWVVQSEVIRLCWALGNESAIADLLQAQIDDARLDRESARRRRELGIGTGESVARAESALRSDRDALESNRAARAQMLAQLARLTGLPIEALSTRSFARREAKLPVAELPPAGPTLRRRIDVREAAIAVLASQDATTVTKAQGYPTLTLAAALALGNGNVSGVLRDPVGTVALALSAPLFDLRQSIALRQADLNEGLAAASFRLTVITALNDIETRRAELDDSLREADVALVERHRSDAAVARMQAARSLGALSGEREREILRSHRQATIRWFNAEFTACAQWLGFQRALGVPDEGTP